MNSKLNRILTIAAIIMVLIWARGFFSSSGGTGGAGLSQLFSSGTVSLIWIAVGVVCFGYLLWRFMSALFWRKYFHGEKPPEDDDSES